MVKLKFQMAGQPDPENGFEIETDDAEGTIKYFQTVGFKFLRVVE